MCCGISLADVPNVRRTCRRLHNIPIAAFPREAFGGSYESATQQQTPAAKFCSQVLHPRTLWRVWALPVLLQPHDDGQDRGVHVDRVMFDPTIPQIYNRFDPANWIPHQYHRDLTTQSWFMRNCSVVVMLANAQQERCDEMLPRVLRHVCQARSIIAGRMVSRSIEAPLILFAALNGLLETVVALISARADVDVPMMMHGEHGAGRTWRHGPVGGCQKRPCPMRECNDLCRQASPFPLRQFNAGMEAVRSSALKYRADRKLEPRPVL